MSEAHQPYEGKYRSKGNLHRKMAQIMDPRQLRDHFHYPIFTGPATTHFVDNHFDFGTGQYSLQGPMVDGHLVNETDDMFEKPYNYTSGQALKPSRWHHPDIPTATFVAKNSGETPGPVTINHGSQAFISQQPARNAANRIGDEYVGYRERMFNGRMAAGAAMDKGIHVHNADMELRHHHIPPEVRDIILDKAFGTLFRPTSARAVHRNSHTELRDHGEVQHQLRETEM